MTKKLFAAVVALMLVLALPAGAAFALSSPSLNSPSLNSPTLNSPTLNSPTLNSPTLNSPTLNSPSLNSPTLNSPTLNSPTLNSPTLNSPSLNSPSLNSPAIEAPSMDAQSAVVSNVEANTLAQSSTGLVTEIAQTGTAYAPAAGAFNLLTIAGGTALALFGAVGAGIALVVVLRRQG